MKPYDVYIQGAAQCRRLELSCSLQDVVSITSHLRISFVAVHERTLRRRRRVRLRLLLSYLFTNITSSVVGFADRARR